MPTSLTDPFAWIKSAKPGTVIYGISQDETGRASLDFWIRESSAAIDAVGDTPTIEWRAGALVEGNVLLVVVLFKAGDAIYETFWDDYKERREIRGINGDEDFDLPARDSLFEMMATEPFVELLFFGDSGEVERSLHVPNGLRSFFAETIQQARAWTPWTPEAFEAAKLTLVENYPKVAELWKFLQQ